LAKIILILKSDLELDVIDVKFDMASYYNECVTTRHTTDEYGKIF